MTGASDQQRKFYCVRLRNERNRQKVAFEARFGLSANDYRWVDPEVNLDCFEPNKYPAAKRRVLPPGLRAISHNDWAGLTALAHSMWTNRETVRLLLDSARSVGAIEMDGRRAGDLFRQLLSADADSVVAATPTLAAWASFDVYSLKMAVFRVDIALRGEWASMGDASSGRGP